MRRRGYELRHPVGEALQNADTDAFFKQGQLDLVGPCRPSIPATVADW
ncbi:MAG TPA: hypothetical protein VI542_10555 [Candidatus Tectomicrobia bacterium]